MTAASGGRPRRRRSARTRTRTPTGSPRPSLSEVRGAIEVGEQTGVRRPPAELLAGPDARGGHVELREVSEPREMFGGGAGREARRRHLQPAADDLGDRAERHAFLVDSVE